MITVDLVMTVDHTFEIGSHEDPLSIQWVRDRQPPRDGYLLTSFPSNLSDSMRRGSPHWETPLL